MRKSRGTDNFEIPFYGENIKQLLTLIKNFVNHNDSVGHKAALSLELMSQCHCLKSMIKGRKSVTIFFFCKAHKFGKNVFDNIDNEINVKKFGTTHLRRHTTHKKLN